MILSERAQFDLAQRVREPEGAAIGEMFAFVSGLYFKGKLAYALTFARPPEPGLPIDRQRRPRHHAERGTASGRDAHHDRRAPRVSRRGHRRERSQVPPIRCSRARARWPRKSATSAKSSCSAASRRRSTSRCSPTSSASACSSPPDFVGPRRHEPRRAAAAVRARRARSSRTSPVIGAVRHGPRPPKLPPVRGILKNVRVNSSLGARRSPSPDSDDVGHGRRRARAPGRPRTVGASPNLDKPFWPELGITKGDLIQVLRRRLAPAAAAHPRPRDGDEALPARGRGRVLLHEARAGSRGPRGSASAGSRTTRATSSTFPSSTMSPRCSGSSTSGAST